MRIAYVEDNAINLALVQRIAMMSGHVITSYTEGETALVGLSQETYDLIMMDVELAGELNGLDVVRALRAHGLTTPIIAVTAYAMMGDREKCLEAGCNDYLPKPLPIADFLALLAHYDTLLQAQKQPVTAAPVLTTNGSAPLVAPAPLLVDTTAAAPPAAAVPEPPPIADPKTDTAKAVEAVVTDHVSTDPALNNDPASVVAAPVQTPALPETPAASGS